MRPIINTLALLAIGFTLIFSSCKQASGTQEYEEELTASGTEEASANNLIYPGETHFKNMRQLTFGGDNAEAYWSFDDKMLVFQSNNEGWGLVCDQIFYTDLENTDMQNQKPQMISTGLGRTTCPYFLPGDNTVVYASTHLGGDSCPPEPERDAGGKSLLLCILKF